MAMVLGWPQPLLEMGEGVVCQAWTAELAESPALPLLSLRLLGGAALQQQWERGQRARLGLALQWRHGEDPAGRSA